MAAVTTSTVAATAAAAPTDIPIPAASLTPEAEGSSPPQPVGAEALPAAQTASWQPVASGLEAPIGIANAGDGSNRLFILEQAGRIRVIQGGELLSQPFLDIVDRVGCCGERGLLGLDFHPRFAENGYFYVNYTDQNGDTIISRFQGSPDDPNRALAESEKPLMYIPQPYPNHNGGAVVFGLDGYLYLGLGDGGSGGDPQGNGQSLTTLLGKILRIDVDNGEPYTIPAGNPFAQGGGATEIFAYGLRNPWRIAFDRLMGDLYIADVGQNAWEEINYLPAGSPAGANFGWNFREGAHPFQGEPGQDLNLIDPVAEYSHGDGCSVTGGAVYRGGQLPAWQGIYLFGDYCSGKVWGLLRTSDGSWQQALLYESGFNITSFGEDEAGEVYLSDYAGGIYRLEPVE
jgi:glucose/arabinose dehydrogenase